MTNGVIKLTKVCYTIKYLEGILLNVWCMIWSMNEQFANGFFLFIV